MKRETVLLLWRITKRTIARERICCKEKKGRKGHRFVAKTMLWRIREGTVFSVAITSTHLRWPWRLSRNEARNYTPKGERRSKQTPNSSLGPILSSSFSLWFYIFLIPFTLRIIISPYFVVNKYSITLNDRCRHAHILLQTKKRSRSLRINL